MRLERGLLCGVLLIGSAACDGVRPVRIQAEVVACIGLGKIGTSEVRIAHFPCRCARNCHIFRHDKHDRLALGQYYAGSAGDGWSYLIMLWSLCGSAVSGRSTDQVFNRPRCSDLRRHSRARSLSAKEKGQMRSSSWTAGAGLMLKC